MLDEAQFKPRPANGIDFEDLKSKAAQKNYKPVYIDMLRDMAVMAFIGENPDTHRLPIDVVRSGVSLKFQKNVESLGGFLPAYQHARDVVKTLGLQIPERKYESVLSRLHSVSAQLESQHNNPASLSRSKRQLFDAVRDWAKASSAFGQNTHILTDLMEKSPRFVTSGILKEVRAVIDSESALTPGHKATSSSFNRLGRN